MSPRYLKQVLYFSLILFLVCAGCVSKSTEQNTSERESVSEYYVHIVKLPNESLSIVAKWFTGDLNNWEELAKHNPTINPNRIFLGDKIQIPRELMITEDPMTLEFVEESQPKPRKKQTASPSSSKPVHTEPAEGDEPFLFGPKEYSKD